LEREVEEKSRARACLGVKKTGATIFMMRKGERFYPLGKKEGFVHLNEEIWETAGSEKRGGRAR